MKREQVLPHVMADMAARIAKGADEYGEPLTTFNGRDALQDAYEEALDLAMYLKQAIMERASATYPVIVLGEEKLEARDWRADRTAQGAAIANMPSAIGAACMKPQARAKPDWSKAPDWAKHWYVDADGRAWWFEHPAILVNNMNWHVQKGRYDSAPIFDYAGHWMNAKSDRPADPCPGPDWSQAPADAIGWVAQNARASSHRALWVFGPGYLNEDGIWTTDNGFKVSGPAPTFGYTGDWRDSLRKRPK